MKEVSTNPTRPTRSTPVPMIKKRSAPAPLPKRKSPPATLVKKRSTPAPLIRKRSTLAPLSKRHSEEPPLIKKRSTLVPMLQKCPGLLTASQRSLATFTTRLSMRNVYGVEVKTGDYEEMVRHFKLRKITKKGEPSLRFTRAHTVIIDKPIAEKKEALEMQRFSWGGLLYILARRTTWVRAWQSLFKPITPGGFVSTLHDVLMFIIYHFQLYYLPFSRVYFPNGSLETTYVGITMEVVFIMNILLRFNTAFMDKDDMVTTRVEIVRNYVGRWFVLDLLSAMPFYTACCLSAGSCQYVPLAVVHHETFLIFTRVLRLVFREHNLLFRRVFKISKHTAQRFHYSRYSNLLEIAKLLWLVLVIAHYMGCFWHMVPHSYSYEDAGIGEQWVGDFHRAVAFIQGEANGNGTWEEDAFSSVAMLVGSIITANVFGNVAMLVANFSANTTIYHRKMESVFAKMDKMELPPPLQERVHQYFTHAWLEHKSLDGDLAKFQRELAHSLELEVGVYKYMPVVMRIPYWYGCSRAFAMQIVLHLDVRVYMPNDYVVRKGETGDEMFMINRGVCEVSNPAKRQKPAFTILSRAEGDQVNEDEEEKEDLGMESSDGFGSDDESEEEIAENAEVDPSGLGLGEASTQGSRLRRTLSNMSLTSRPMSSSRNSQVRPQKSNYEMDPGVKKTKSRIFMYPGKGFGEMSLVMNYSRTANVRAATFVDMCVFNRDDFQRILTRFPKDRRRVLTSMLENCIEKKEIPFPWEQILEAVAERRKRKGIPDGSFDPTDNAITSAEAARALVERIDIDVPDETIKYGFQSFKTNISDYPSPAWGIQTARKQNGDRRRRSSGQVPHPHRGSRKTASDCDDESGSDDGSVPSEYASAQASRIDGLEKMLTQVLGVVSSMGTTVQQLGQTVEQLNQTVERLETAVTTQGDSHSCCTKVGPLPPIRASNTHSASDTMRATSHAGTQTISELSVTSAATEGEEHLGDGLRPCRPFITKTSPPRGQPKSQEVSPSAATPLRRIQSTVLDGIASKLTPGDFDQKPRADHVRSARGPPTARDTLSALAPIPSGSVPNSTQRQPEAEHASRQKVAASEVSSMVPAADGSSSPWLIEAVAGDVGAAPMHTAPWLSRTTSPTSSSSSANPPLMTSAAQNYRKTLGECGKSNTATKITAKPQKLAARSSLPSDLHEALSAASEAVHPSPRTSAATQVARGYSSRPRRRRSAVVAICDQLEPEEPEEKAAPPLSPRYASEVAGSLPVVVESPLAREGESGHDTRRNPSEEGDPTARGAPR